MDEIAILRRQISELEARKPSADQDPTQHRAINDEISRICDRINVLKTAWRPRSVV